MTNIEGRLANRFAFALPDLPRSEIPRAVQSSVPKWGSLAIGCPMWSSRLRSESRAE